MQQIHRKHCIYDDERLCVNDTIWTFSQTYLKYYFIKTRLVVKEEMQQGCNPGSGNLHKGPSGSCCFLCFFGYFFAKFHAIYSMLLKSAALGLFAAIS